MTHTTRLPFETPHTLGSILYRPKRDAYEIRYRERPGELQRSRYVRGDRSPATYRRAEQELASWIHASSRGERSVSRTLTVGAWLDRWLDTRAPSMKAGTRDAYETRIELYLKPVLGKHKLADLEPDDVTRAMSRLSTMRGARTARISPGTVDAAYKVLNAALSDAFDLGKAPRNACRGSQHVKSTTVIEPPTQRELDAIMRELETDPWYPLFETIRWTGARLGEILGLEWRNVPTWAGGELTGELRLVRQRSGALKTKASPRPVFVPPHVRRLLEELRDRDTHAGIVSPYVFVTRTGKPLDERNVLRRFDAACDRAGVRPHELADRRKYRIHDLRHANATTLLEAGVSPHVVQRWLGHKTLAMLDRYAHVAPRPGGDAYHRLADAFGEELEEIFSLRPRTLRILGPESELAAVAELGS